MPPVGRRHDAAVTGLAALAATLSLGLLSGCTGDDDSSPPPAPPTTVALDEIDLSSVAVARAPFCERLDESADTLAEALAGEPRRTDAWESGDRRRVGGSRDVLHEAGCSYRRAGSEAGAWVFAQPVTRLDARGLLEQRRTTPGCESAGELAFGSPGLVQLCREDGSRLVTMAGLFGDAWLTCQVSTPRTGPAADALERAQRWCVEVVYAAGPA